MHHSQQLASTCKSSKRLPRDHYYTTVAQPQRFRPVVSDTLSRLRASTRASPAPTAAHPSTLLPWVLAPGSPVSPSVEVWPTRSGSCRCVGG
ncbi:hypothetical protein OPT61_g7391 [Boeremia exigua]|uniref:Uncharacterized protein n=1 Tax=Boeremia exigua TaxID=749465 RepID=A0ACC2I2F4_9PLEO|nr:hypothetical protein OPT61_g7391 [Boeremia exigua]